MAWATSTPGALATFVAGVDAVGEACAAREFGAGELALGAEVAEALAEGVLSDRVSVHNRSVQR